MFFIFLAAGKGKRMNSSTTKVLIPVMGKPMLHWIIDSVNAVRANASGDVGQSKIPDKNMIFIVGENQDQIQQSLLTAYPSNEFTYIRQVNANGTGDAIRSTLSFFREHSEINEMEQVLILPGDVPTISAETILEMMSCENHRVNSVLVHNATNPFGCGRILFDNGSSENFGSGTKVLKIIEEKDCNDTTRKISCINCGIYTMTVKTLFLVDRLDNKNAAGEYYLTDLLEIAYKENMPFDPVFLPAEKSHEFFNVNTQDDLKNITEFLSNK
jgi:bifunctional UDP-N-acetylglucosamine pyrophosphorylase/glucosamine-1-phosphate N-acetyltransferase